MLHTLSCPPFLQTPPSCCPPVAPHAEPSGKARSCLKLVTVASWGGQTTAYGVIHSGGKRGLHLNSRTHALEK